MNNFTFDKEKHEYQLDGKVLPSVSQIIGAASLLPTAFYLHDAGTSEAVLRGSYTHQATELHDKGTLDETSVCSQIRPYLEAYKAFRKESGFTPASTECRLYHPAYYYAGTIDRIGRLNTRLVLLDIKTGSPTQAITIQLAAYAELMTANKLGLPEDVVVLYLKNTGRYTLKILDLNELAEAHLIFLNALELYNYRKRHNLL